MRKLNALFAVLLCLTAGCSKQTPPTISTSAEKPVVQLEPIDAKEFAVLKGRVIFDGTPPADVGGSIKNDHYFALNEDSKHCLADPSKHSETDLTWVISRDDGVANVAVWVRPPDGCYFRLPEEKSWQDAIIIDTPYCSFVPRVAIAFSGFFEGHKMTPTGQKLQRINSGPLVHNIHWSNFLPGG